MRRSFVRFLSFRLEELTKRLVFDLRVGFRCPGTPAVDISKVLMNNDGVFPVDQP